MRESCGSFKEIQGIVEGSYRQPLGSISNMMQERIRSRDGGRFYRGEDRKGYKAKVEELAGERYMLPCRTTKKSVKIFMDAASFSSVQMDN